MVKPSDDKRAVIRRAAFFGGLVAIAIIILFLRRPDAFLVPQFWAEDGKFWYADAYNYGPWGSILMPYAGSLQLAMRLVGSLAVLGPLRFAPTFFVLVAILIKLLPAVLINAKRFAGLIPDVRARLLITVFYLLIPSGYEVHANLTNINWHLALLAFMVIVVRKSTSRPWRMFDVAVTVLAGLTGPFAIILSLVAFLNFRQHKNSQNKMLLKILVVCAVLQIIILLLGPGNARLSQPLAPSIALFFQIIGARIGLATIIGSNLAGRLLQPQNLISLLSGLVVVGVTILCYLKARFSLRLLIIFSWLTLAAALLKPQASDMVAQWPALLLGAGARYFFLPILTFFICLVSLVANKNLHRLIRGLAAIAIVSCLLLAVPSDFRYQAPRNLSFSYFEQQFRETPHGQTYCIPINPQWYMCLRKH